MQRRVAEDVQCDWVIQNEGNVESVVSPKLDVGAWIGINERTVGVE